MRGNGKKARHPDSGKSSFSNTENGSLLIASLKLKKGLKACKGKTCKQKSQFRLKKISAAALSKPLINDTLSKRIWNDSASRKLICRRVLQKAHDKKCSKKIVSSKLQRKPSSIVTSDKNEENAKKSSRIKKCEKRKNKRRQKDKTEMDEPLRLQRRARYLMIKMKLEQNLIDAYSGEGWKGQSREKIKPERELLRARKQILNCKLRLRDAICQLDRLSKVGCIEDSVIAPDGSVCHEHIFCAKCKSNEVFPDNDIVLCDGMCNCAFHQKCLDPPLHTENIPPGDQGWFCKFCECRMEIIEAMNAHLGTHFSMNSNWQDIFKEEAALPDGDGISINQEQEWPSDDSEDDDYDPERMEKSMSGAGTDDDASDDATSSTSLGWSSDGEIFSGSRKWEMESEDFRNHSIYSGVDSETSDGEIICGRRQRRAVDYKKLYDEMFGKDPSTLEHISEDEDWGPHKRKRKEKESDAASTLMRLCESETKNKKAEDMKRKRKLTRDLQVRRSFCRMPSHAVEKLRKVFAENELPSRTVKENLSKELGLEPGKVGKWFKNARYLALKSRKMERGKLLHTSKVKKMDSAALEDSLVGTGECTLENIKKVHRKKKPKLMSSNLKKNEQGIPSFGTTVSSNEMRRDQSDDVSLKRLLKTKTRRVKKRVELFSSLLAEAEMERLSRAKVRLENMKETLTRLQNNRITKSSRVYMHKDSVIYVPVAELREKE